MVSRPYASLTIAIDEQKYFDLASVISRVIGAENISTWPLIKQNFQIYNNGAFCA